MNHTSTWVCLVTSLAMGSVATLGCDRNGNDETSVGAPSLTSADLPMTASDTGPLVCERASDDPTTAACVDPATSQTGDLITLPVVLLTSRPTSKGSLKGKTAASAKSRDSSPLDDAMKGERDKRTLDKAELERTANENATPPAPTRAEMTTPSPTLPPAPAAAPVAPANTTRISFASRLPSTYTLRRLRMNVDGKTEYDASIPGSVSLPSGHHVVQVIADYKLRDPIFTYVDDYGVVLESTEDVPATSAPIDLVALAVRSGGVTSPMDKQAALEWRTAGSR